MILLFTVEDRREVRGRVERRAVGLQDDAGRNLLAVALLCDIDNQRTFGLVRIAVLFHFFDHARDQRLDRRLPVPQIKINIQVRVVALHVGDGDFDDLLPQRVQAGIALLQPVRVLHGLLVVSLVLLGFCARGGIDLLEVTHGKRRLFRIGRALAVRTRGKIRKVREPVLQFGDDQSHLKAPVAHMDIADALLAVVTDDALHGFADDRGAHVTYMQRLCDIRPAVVQDDALRHLRVLQSKLLRLPHLVQVITDEALADRQVQETGLHCLNFCKNRRIRKSCRDFFRDHNRCLVVLLCTGHRAVALVLTQVGAVRDRHLPQATVIAGRLKGFPHLFTDCL